MADEPVRRTREAESLRRQLTAWIHDQVDGSGLRGAVIGLSGGIDSAVVCGLAAEAIGAERCMGVIMPIESAAEDARLAEDVAARFGVGTVTVELTEPFRVLFDALVARREDAERAAGGAGDPRRETAPIVTERSETLARANVKPRLRMVALYYYANLLDYLVLGTGNKAERTVGYFTKWGDGAADAFPLADLVKREVRDLARTLAVPDAVIERAPSAGLWTGQTDEDELGFGYDALDRFVLTGSSGREAVDREIERRSRLSRHKLAPPPLAAPE